MHQPDGSSGYPFLLGDEDPIPTTTRHSQDEFFAEASKTGVDVYLDKLVEQRRLDYKDQNGQQLYAAITETLQRLKDVLVSKQRRFNGEFIGVGSYHDGTKLTPADEYDFMYRLYDFDLDDNYTLQRFTTRQVSKHMTIRDFSHGRLQLCEKKHDTWYDCTINGQSNTETLYPELSSRALLNKFRTLVHQSMKNIKLPEGLVHGGWSTPAFGGTDRNGPAVTLLLRWKPNTENELDVTVDLIFCFSAPDKISQLVMKQLPMNLGPTVGVSDLVLIAGYNDEDWVIATSVVEQKFTASKLMTPSQRNALRKKILLGKIINADYLTLYDSPVTEQLIINIHGEVREFQARDGCYTNLAPTLKSFEDNRGIKRKELTDLVLLNTGPDPGISMGFLVYMQEKKQNYPDAFYMIHPRIRRFLHERVEPHCTIVSCMFKVIALTQHFEGITETSSSEMLVNQLKEIYGQAKCRTTMLEITADTWKCGPYIREKTYSFDTEVTTWCKQNTMKFFHKLVKMCDEKVQ